MELQRIHKSIHPPFNHFRGEKEQMLNLNQRLESYLSRVKLLDEENAKLTKEIQALRRNHHGNLERRTFLDEELRNARLEVDVVWKERVYAEVDVARLSEELRSLELQLQRETQAQVEAKAKADQSRRELEEERRAQIWLKEKVNQLEHEMKSLILSHQEEVAHMEAALMQPRAVRPVVQHGPNLLELGQEYSQRAARAWEEAAQAYQDQLSRLEESVNETRQKLVQANKEKGESVLKLQNLDRELLGLQELREHLEGTVEQQTEGHCRDVQMLQEHLEDLEREKQALTQKMEHLLQENRGLSQMKMSLSMEVATYRALLDSEILKGDISLQKQPRSIYSKDAAFSPWRVNDNYHISPCSKTTSTSMTRSVNGKTKPQATMATPVLYQKYVPRGERAEDRRVYQQLELTPYPKVLKDGAVENFRPQEVHEKVTNAEPLSPPDEQEAFKTLEVEKELDFWNDTVDQPFEEQVSREVEPCLNKEVPLEETGQQLVEPALIEESSSFAMKSELLEMQVGKEYLEDSQAPADARFEEEYVTKSESVQSNLSHHAELAPINEDIPELVQPFTEDSFTAVKSEMQDIPFENVELEKPQEPMDAWAEEEYVNITEQPCVESSLSNQVESVSNDETGQELVEEPFIEESCSVAVKSELQKVPSATDETEKPQALIAAWTEKEPIEDSKDVQEQQESSDSETEAFVEPDFDTKSSSPASEEFQKNQLGDHFKEDFTFDSVGVSRADVSPPKEKLYPDGEEMDTWDSVIEQNQDVKAENVEEQEEATRQHAEPEEDISAREAQQQLQQDMIQDIEMEAKMESQTGLEEQNPDESQEDEQEDSQNVSVSWRTELEGDSYAQDNTLADTRPLIRYKSDDTDANTQASHVDDADDSSDSEQDKKVGEMASGAWMEDKARKFGTMEDLCEEAEGEALDEEFDLEYVKNDRRDDEQENKQENYDDSQEEEVITVVDEELDTDKLVEQELESLTTECYTTQFALHQACAKDTAVLESFTEQPKAWKEALQDSAETLDMEDFLTIEAQVEEKGDELTETPKSDKREDEELAEVEGDKHNISMVTHCDTTQDITEIRKELENVEDELEEQQLTVQDLIINYESKSIVEDSHDDTNQSNKPTSANPETHPDNEVEIRDTTPEEIFIPEEVDTEVEDDNPLENVDCDENKIVTNLAQRSLSSDDKVDNDSLSPTDEPLNQSPERVHEDEDFFIVKDSKTQLKTNGKAHLDDLYNIGGNDDFWMSPLETGATCQPDVVDTKHKEWELGFGDVASRESENFVSKSDMAFEQKDVTQIKSAVTGELVHSEESEYDSEVMSSGEE